MAAEQLYDGHGWRLTMDSYPLPDGRSKRAVRVHRCDSVHLLALPTPSTVLVLREFRPYRQQWIWMLPSGKADKEDDVLSAAQRELREETGFRAERITPFFTCFGADSITTTNHVFLAEGLTPDPLPQDDTELLEVHELPRAEALDRVLGCGAVHAASALGLYRLLSREPDIDR